MAGARHARRAFGLYERLYGADHPQVGGVLAVLGTILVSTRQWPAAKQVLRLSLGVVERAAGAESIDTAEPLVAKAARSRLASFADVDVLARLDAWIASPHREASVGHPHALPLGRRARGERGARRGERVSVLARGTRNRHHQEGQSTRR